MAPRVLVALLAIGWVRTSSAHDFWIEPKLYRADPPVAIDFSLKVGSASEVEELPWRDNHCERCLLVLDAAEFAVFSANDSVPALRLDFEQRGTWTLAYRSFDRFLELDAEKFESYLREEGLERIVEARAALGESGKRAKESYSRCAKALLRIGTVEGIDLPGPKAIGHPLELIAEIDPYTLSATTELPVSLRLRGAPLAGALVKAVRADDSRRTLAARSDQAGRVEFELEPGPWRISAVHMERAQKGPTTDWKSLWATLTFERPAVDDSASRDAEPTAVISSDGAGADE